MDKHDSEEARERALRAIIQEAKAQGLDPAEVLAGLNPDAHPGQAGLSPEAEALLSRVLRALAGEQATG